MKGFNRKEGQLFIDDISLKDIAKKFGVQSIPTFIMFKDGKVIQQMVGAVGEPGIHMICKKFLPD